MFYADIDSISNCFMLMSIILVSIKRGSLSHLYTADQKCEEGVFGIRRDSEHTLPALCASAHAPILIIGYSNNEYETQTTLLF